MAKFKMCVEHGSYEVTQSTDTCPKCPKPVDKSSKKYKATIVIPPHMRAVR